MPATVDYADAGKLAALVQEAREKYDQAQGEARAARSSETERLNQLNNAQKQLDAWYDNARKDAPLSSDWKKGAQ